jgi:hypothetical protein
MDWMNLIKTVGPSVASAAGALASGRSAGRDTQNSQAMSQDQMRLQARGQDEVATQGRARIEMDQASTKRNLLNDAYRAAIASNLALNMKDVNMTRPEGIPTMKYEGGARPSAIGAGGREAAALMARKAMDNMMNEPEFRDVSGSPAPFRQTEMKQGNIFDTILGTAGAVGQGFEQHQARQEASSNNALIQQILKAAQEDALRERMRTDSINNPIPQMPGAIRMPNINLPGWRTPDFAGDPNFGAAHG